MFIKLQIRPVSLEEQIKALAPWGQYYKFDDETITGFFTSITSPEDAVQYPENTYCLKTDEASKKMTFNRAYNEMITDSKRQFMLIDVLTSLMGSDFHTATAYEFGCNDGMKTLYFKQKGVKAATGFEYREDCIRRANYINDLTNLECKFVHYPVSADNSQYATGIEAADIVASFGVLHHLVDHKTHIEQLSKITKKVLLVHVAFRPNNKASSIIIENCKENSFKSVTGQRILPAKEEIIDLLYSSGFSYVLDIQDHPNIDTKGFANFMTYLIAVK